jgi:hypothetical protein
MRTRRAHNWLALAPLIGFALSAAAASGQNLAPDAHHSNAATIYVDPDVRVSRDGAAVHMETYISASATNPDLLIAGGEVIFPDRRTGASEAQIYRSADAGARWSPALLPNEVNGGWDNAIAGGPGDTGYFLTSNSERGLTLYRTADGGATWVSTVLSLSWDRPHVALDTNDDPFRGNLYVAGEADDGVRVTRSGDGGNTFSAPVTACAHPKDWNVATSLSPLVLRDGTLVVPCLPYPNDPERASWTNADVGLVFSRDGGRTFGPYHKIFTVHRALDRDGLEARARGIVALSGNFMQGPVFAVAPPAAGRFADRVYAAWQDVDSSGASQLLTAHSEDQGLTWSRPAPVADASSSLGGAPARQCVPMLAVSRDGVLGVAWFDGRLAPDWKGYDVYFAASEDGGATFLPAVRVSTATSWPASGLNILPSFDVGKSEASDALKVQISSPFSERATGGDYSNMAVDAAGRFHPLWADARSGAWQIYTATVRVLTAGTLAKLLEHATCPVTSGGVELVLDEPSLDEKSNDATVSVRVVNISAGPIAGTITIRVSPSASSAAAKKEDNASLVYQFTPAQPLFPNSISAPQLWNLHTPAGGFRNFSYAAVIAGFACEHTVRP